MRGRVSNTVSHLNTKSEAQKTADNLDQQAQIQKRGERFLYYPSELSTESLQNIKTKSTDDYLKDNCLTTALSKPVYNEEEFVYDIYTKKWKLVNKALNTYNLN